MPKMILLKCSASTPRAKYKDKRLKVILSQESELCYVENERQRPLFISSR
jgi:hypothetical protein